MTFRMLDNQGEIEGYASAVAQVAGIPQQHVEKDFWITEALRGVANASRETKCSVIFKGGTSLERPPGGFAQSPAWTSGQDDVEQSYNDVLRLLVWPNAATSTFEECCERVHALTDLL